MPLEPESDLPWTAFLYVTGDLTPDESSSFELRLADDQEAREAVAVAVELAGALTLVGPDFARRGKPMLRRVFIGTTAIAAAAGLLLAIVPAFRPIEPGQPDTSEVALTWSGLRVGVDADWASFAAGPQAAGRADAGQVVEDEAEAGLSTERVLPSWLLTAASAPRDDSPRQED